MVAGAAATNYVRKSMQAHTDVDILKEARKTLNGNGAHKKSLAAHDPKAQKDINEILKEDNNAFKVFFDSGKFDSMVAPLILLNVLLIGVEIDQNPSDAGARSAWIAVNSIWNIVWFAEMCLKVYCLRKSYLDYPFNRFDLFLMFTAVIDTWILPFVPGEVGAQAAEWALTFRVLRILRLLRFVNMFENLWQIVDGFLKALNPLSWTLLLLTICIYSFAVYLTLMVGHRCEYEYVDWGDCDPYFGGVVRSMWSLIQVLTLDSWSSGIARPIIDKKPFLCLFFLLYIMLGVFGMLNIIVGVIVESTLESKKALETERVKKRLHAELDAIKAVFQTADADHSGGIDYNEFQHGLENPDLVRMFAGLGFDIESDPRAVFDMLDHDHTGFITIQEFVEGILQLKHPPTRLDVYSSAKMAFVRAYNPKLGLPAPASGEVRGQNKDAQSKPGSSSAVLQALEMSQRGLQDAQRVMDTCHEGIREAMNWIIKVPDPSTTAEKRASIAERARERASITKRNSIKGANPRDGPRTSVAHIQEILNVDGTAPPRDNPPVSLEAQVSLPILQERQAESSPKRLSRQEHENAQPAQPNGDGDAGDAFANAVTDSQSITKISRRLKSKEKGKGDGTTSSPVRSTPLAKAKAKGGDSFEGERSLRPKSNRGAGPSPTKAEGEKTDAVDTIKF